jgi:hypothetical protein
MNTFRVSALLTVGVSAFVVSPSEILARKKARDLPRARLYAECHTAERERWSHGGGIDGAVEITVVHDLGPASHGSVMRLFKVSGSAQISIATIVDAESEAEARVHALGNRMCDIASAHVTNRLDCWNPEGRIEHFDPLVVGVVRI